MKLWIFLAIAILLIVWGSREGFNPATERPTKTDTSLRRSVESIVGTTTPSVVDSYIDSIGKFYDTKYLPEKKTPEVETVKEFVNAEEMKPEMTKDKLTRSIEYVFLSTTPPPSSGGTPPSSSSTSAGGTTGGSSTSSSAPNSGGTPGGSSDRTKQVFGPTFTGRGEGGGVTGADSSKTNQYPELMGGGNTKPSTRTPGGDITSPSKSWQLSMNGSLPSSASLGTDENSKFLPFSRQPGDMELIPDPYRVSQSFSSANYGFKTEPLPFLTDFSAFQR